MIRVIKHDKENTIKEDFTLKLEDKELELDVKMALEQYDCPAQGFKTSFVAQVLKNYGYKIIELIDEEMENSPDNRVY